ncbi:MAG: methylmalonyl-CoA mutase family protein [Propionibacteriaceae bacterium]|nr:methylmalonyl-CoA mutase family protein [Propionibacteriaceae bacterium]
MTDDTLVLAGDFPQPTRQDWDREVLKVMNRRRPPGSELTIEQAMKRLTTTTVDGLVVDPLYTRTDEALGWPAQTPFTRGSEVAPGWTVEQLHEDADAARTNGHVLDDLNRGASGVWLRVDTDAIAPADLAAALKGVVPGAADIAVSSLTEQAEAAEALLAFLASTGKASEARGTLGIDPLGAAAVTGATPDLSKLAAWVAKTPGAMQAICVDVTGYDNAGAGDVQQLAYAVATGIAYIRALGEQGVDATKAFAQIRFRVSASADQFDTICRLRALRRLWARVGEVLGVPEDKRGATQHAVTSWRVLSKDDPWVNLLRVTVGAFASAVGGAELVSTLPHDTAYGLPTVFSRRIARNIQLVAAEEAHVGAVKDPAGGAWYVEHLTEQMAQKAWALVQEIESKGGMAQAIADGTIAAQVAQVASARAKLLATRKLPLTGVSMFPKPDEQPLTDFVERPARPDYKGLPQHRDAEVFETLRARSRAHQAATGAHPAVLLACLGEQRDFGGREQFTSNMLWVAGLDTPELHGASADEIAQEAKAKGYKVVVLASNTKVYAEQAIAAATALKNAGVPRVCIAGRRTETGDEAAAASVIDQEIFDGMDVVAFLGDTLDQLGVSK